MLFLYATACSKSIHRHEYHLATIAKAYVFDKLQEGVKCDERVSGRTTEGLDSRKTRLDWEAMRARVNDWCGCNADHRVLLQLMSPRVPMRDPL